MKGDRRRWSRRDFLKASSALAALAGLPDVFIPKIARVLEAAAVKRKPPVIWMEGQDCAGCSESLLNALSPLASEIVLDVLSIRYHETIMAASGHLARQALEKTIEEGGYILVLEGSIPTAENGRFCMVAGEPYIEHVRRAARNAVAIIAAGACASFGGIPRAGGTGAKGAQDVLPGHLVINVPSCPVKPSRLIGTIMHYLLFKKLPPLDKYNRPIPYYGYLQHDNCPRRAYFEQGKFLTDWNDPSQSRYCLLLKGCKGPWTYTDCFKTWWNDGVNYCINAGSPCSGCTQPEFYAGFSPLYEKQVNLQVPRPGVAGVDVDTIGAAMAVGTAVAIGVHAVVSAVKGRIGEREMEEVVKDEGKKEEHHDQGGH